MWWIIGFKRIINLIKDYLLLKLIWFSTYQWSLRNEISAAIVWLIGSFNKGIRAPLSSCTTLAPYLSRKIHVMIGTFSINSQFIATSVVFNILINSKLSERTIDPEQLVVVGRFTRPQWLVSFEWFLFFEPATVLFHFFDPRPWN